jgi:formyltetrahydrofolate deformylase
MTKQTLILIQCQDAVGLVSNISNVLAKHKLNIITMREYVDEENNKFFVRVVCTGYVEESNGLYSHLKAVLPEKASISINPSKRKRIAVLVTKEHHCLADILVRNYFDTLNADVCAVIGNYDNLRDFAERFSIPYYHISHENKTKEDFEDELAVQLKALNPDFIVLAKFMRILSPTFVKEFEHRIINIHHSFIGANPYKQAHDRGVKIIGATAHFVTNDLDEGPIIVQNIKNIDHSYDVHKMKRTGQEIEKAVLTRAIQLIVEDRVMLNGNKTIVFKA